MPNCRDNPHRPFGKKTLHFSLLISEIGKAKRPQKATYKPLVEQIEATGPHTDCNKTNHIFSTDSNVALHPKHAPGHEESAKLHFAGPEKGAARDKTI